MRGRLRGLFGVRVSRRAVVHLLRAVGNVGLLHKRGLPWVLQVDQRRYGGPALCLRFQGQPQKRLQVLLILLVLRSACQAGEDGLQGCCLAYQHGLQGVQVTALDLCEGVAQLVDQNAHIGIFAHHVALIGVDH